MQYVAADSRRISTTPNATMTTLASPTLGAAGQSLWLVEMNPGAAGPVHAFDAEVLWSLTRGACELHADDTSRTLRAGDTVVLPAGMMRQFVAGDSGFSAIATSPSATAVTREDGTVVGTPEWVA